MISVSCLAILSIYFKIDGLVKTNILTKIFHNSNKAQNIERLLTHYFLFCAYNDYIYHRCHRTQAKNHVTDPKLNLMDKICEILRLEILFVLS